MLIIIRLSIVEWEFVFVSFLAISEWFIGIETFLMIFFYRTVALIWRGSLQGGTQQMVELTHAWKTAQQIILSKNKTKKTRKKLRKTRNKTKLKSVTVIIP